MNFDISALIWELYAIDASETGTLRNYARKWCSVAVTHRLARGQVAASWWAKAALSRQVHPAGRCRGRLLLAGYQTVGPVAIGGIAAAG